MENLNNAAIMIIRQGKDSKISF